MQLNGLTLLTLRELWARRITPGVFIVSTVAWLMLTFAINLDVVDGSLAAVRIFGNTVEAEREYSFEDRETGETVTGVDRPFGENPLRGFVVGIQAFIAGATYWLGLLLALFATATLITGLQDRGTIDLLLSKPISRFQLLGGRLLGIWGAVLVLVMYLIGMVWLVMSLKSGIWNLHFLITIGVITGVFIAMYGVVTLLSVLTNSTPLALIVTYGLIFVSIILNLRDEIEGLMNPTARSIFVFLYHLLPNFAEVTMTVVQLAQGEPVAKWYPFWETIAFGAVCYALALYRFQRKDF